MTGAETRRGPAGRVDIPRLLRRLDDCFAADDLPAAGRLLRAWETEARGLGDESGLISILNEEIGFYRRTGEKEPALAAVREAIALVAKKGIGGRESGATVLVNAATTLKAFGLAAEGLPFYDEAERSLLAAGRGESFTFAALLNNKGGALADLGRCDEAEACYRRAMAILRAEGAHDGEIAVSLVNLAHLFWTRDPSRTEPVEAALDEAWEYIHSPRQPHDANYAFILSKCAPSYRFFGREMEADALEAVSREIYGGAK